MYASSARHRDLAVFGESYLAVTVIAQSLVSLVELTNVISVAETPGFDYERQNWLTDCQKKPTYFLLLKYWYVADTNMIYGCSCMHVWTVEFLDVASCLLLVYVAMKTALHSITYARSN